MSSNADESPQNSKNYGEDQNLPRNDRSYQALIRSYTSLMPGYKYETIHHQAGEYADCNIKVKQEVDLFKKKISTMPVIALIHIWTDLLHISNSIFSDRYFVIMKDLIDSGLIECINKRTGQLLTIGEFADWSPQYIIDEIRCFEGWSIDKREDCVKFFCEFSNWLSRDTFGCIHRAEDYDREVTKQRKLHFDEYIEILKCLDLRERIIAKIFYLGGSRSLEDVLSIRIELINFHNQTILFTGDSVKYSRHVFEDIKKLTEGRNNGYVFTGRQGERINHTVPYRALKTVTSNMGLDTAFTFKEFVKNI